MEIKTRHLGAFGGSAADIIEVTITDYTGNITFTETITSLNGKVDKDFIQNLRDIADELQEQNVRVCEKTAKSFTGYLGKVTATLEKLGREDIVKSRGYSNIVTEPYNGDVPPEVVANTLHLAFPFNEGHCPGCGRVHNEKEH